MIKIIKQNYILILTFIFVLIVSIFVPLLGDDWGNISDKNTIVHYINVAVGSFKTFEGRFFSRITDLLFVNNKWLWNILNATMFTFLIYFINKIVNRENKSKIMPILIFLSLFLIDKEASNQVYFWVVGNATYFVPMVYSLLVLFIYDRVFEGKLNNSKWLYFLIIPSFVFSLFVENVSVGIISIEILLMLVDYIKNKKINLCLLLMTIASIVGTLLMITSPGTRGRMGTEAAFYNLSLLGRIKHNLQYFIEYTFIKNPTVLILLTLVSVSLCKSIKNKVLKWSEIFFLTVVPLITIVIYILGYVKFIDLFNISVLNIVIKMYWIIYMVNFLVIIFKLYKFNDKWKIICYLLIAMSSNVAMLIAPIWGGRTALFTTIYLIIALLIMIKNIDIRFIDSKWFKVICYIAITGVFVLYIGFYSYTSYLNSKRHEYIKEQLKDNKETLQIIALPGRFLLNSNLETEWHQMIFKKIFNIDENKKIELVKINNIDR